MQVFVLVLSLFLCLMGSVVLADWTDYLNNPWRARKRDAIAGMLMVIGLCGLAALWSWQ